MKDTKNYQIRSTAGLHLKMRRWKDYRVILNNGCQFNVAAFGNHSEFKSFCKACSVCKEKCNRDIFIDCINSKKEDDLLVFKNRKEAQDFFQVMFF